MRSTSIRAVAVASLLAHGCSRGDTRPATSPPGRQPSPATAVLEAGAQALQAAAPLAQMGVFIVGFHPMKDDPSRQVEAHHYCNQVNEDFAQCVLFDGNGPQANLTGIEYIVSEKVFESLPPEERPYWHPHNYEILSGTLVAPGLPAAAEKAFLQRKMNSYGKTWHVWMTGTPERPGDPLPRGPAHLAWSFNRDGEASPALIAARDRRFRVDTAAKRRERAALARLARPQEGVDALRDAFPQAGSAPAGVSAKAAVR